MRAFFKGWRRKVGSVALLMAIGLAVLWMRSKFAADSFQFYVGNQGHELASCRGGLSWGSWDSGPQPWNWHTVSDEDISVRIGEDSLAEILGRQAALYPSFRFWIAMYWWLVLSLTLLSCWLILWKPRRQAKASEHQ